MKKLVIMMALVATLVSNGAYAQNNNNNRPNNANRNANTNNTGTAAQQGTYSTYDNLAWGIGLGGLAVIGVVVGVTVAGALKDPPSFSH